MEPFEINDTIAAISSPPGSGGVALIRVSGAEAINIVDEAWKGKRLKSSTTHTVHLGEYTDIKGNVLDQCVASIFFSPASFTGENVVELSVHGSPWIQREILSDLVNRGVRIARPGEFTQRAFLNGKLDLTQAEGVADLIASSSKAAHDLAISQTKGTFSREFDALRNSLIELASLLELELDFSEEDVEFADRSKLRELTDEILNKITKLTDSFATGSVLKNGVPVVIAGLPNAGKSSLLNLLLGDEKAIVTEIPGTTRDTIEDTIEINGILYRFIDTAGIRETSDVVEGIGVDRAKKALDKAKIILWVVDTTKPLKAQLSELSTTTHSTHIKNLILILNKADLLAQDKGQEILKNIQREHESMGYNSNSIILFSTLQQLGLKELLEELHNLATAGQNPENDIILTNARHYEALKKASTSLKRVRNNLTPESKLSPDAIEDNVPSDLLAQDIREAISHLSEITGTITSDTLLHSIFSRFCIGK